MTKIADPSKHTGPFFEVTETAYAFKRGACYTTFVEAERVARANFKRGVGASAGFRSNIGKSRISREQVAEVRGDALGRVWTDLIGIGATLV